MNLTQNRGMLHPLVALKSSMSEGNSIVVAKRHMLTDGNKFSMIDSCVRSYEEWIGMIIVHCRSP